MKTIEEKAKAYDEALERVRELIAKWTGKNKDFYVEDYAYIFPELKESEDERIRKWLVDYFSSIKETVWIHRDITCGQILAWLEKQKDASYAIEAVERIDKYIDEHLANAHDMKDSDPDKKYYRGWDDALGKMAGILQDVYSGEKRKEQKPVEWKPSEEDEKRIKQLIYDTEAIRAGYEKRKEKLGDEFNNELIRDCDAQIAWLKSLRPSQKLSEDQIYTLERICSNLHLRASDDAPKLDEIIKLLKQK
jgi:hypothetical protein